jgi:transposase
LALLVTIPGIDWVVAATVIAEIGVYMSVFPSHRHLAAWGGTCPGNNESAGKRKPIGARKGNPDLKTALCNVATAASRKRGSFFKAKYHKLKSHRGAGAPPWRSLTSCSFASTIYSPAIPPTASSLRRIGYPLGARR